jgi:hypothetical protein
MGSAHRLSVANEDEDASMRNAGRRIGSTTSAVAMTITACTCMLLAGCGGQKKTPVLEDDSPAEIALKQAGANIERVPAPMTTIEDKIARNIDLTDVRITPEIMSNVSEVVGVQELKMTGSTATDEALAGIGGLEHLMTLYLNGSAVTDAGLKHLQSVPSLIAIHLNDTKVTAPGLAELPKSTSVLYLENVSIGDEDLESLKALKRLTLVNLKGTQVTPAGVAKLRETYPKLLVMGINLN